MENLFLMCVVKFCIKNVQCKAPACPCGQPTHHSQGTNTLNPAMEVDPQGTIDQGWNPSALRVTNKFFLMCKRVCQTQVLWFGNQMETAQACSVLSPIGLALQAGTLRGKYSQGEECILKIWDKQITGLRTKWDGHRRSQKCGTCSLFHSLLCATVSNSVRVFASEHFSTGVPLEPFIVRVPLP